VEIATSFGPLRGRIWRIGLMGYNAQLSAALAVLTGLEHILRSQGLSLPRGAGVEVARTTYLGWAEAPIAGQR
jgi:(S)-ureidoglycine---glyoxylate transaminase